MSYMNNKQKFPPVQEYVTWTHELVSDKGMG